MNKKNILIKCSLFLIMYSKNIISIETNIINTSVFAIAMTGLGFLISENKTFLTTLWEKKKIKKIKPIIGYKAELEKMNTIMENFLEEYKEKVYKNTHSDGILLYGPIGTGKTTLAIYILDNLTISFTIINGQETSTHEFKKLLINAVKKAPHAIIIDEIDSIIYEGSSYSEILISFMDGLEDTSGVIIIGTTNHLRHLPQSLFREGRFGNIIKIGLPLFEDRKKILSYYFKEYQVKVTAEMLEYITKKTEGYNNADIAGLCQYINQNKKKQKNKNKDKNNLKKIDNALTKEEFNLFLEEKKNTKFFFHNDNNIEKKTFDDLCLHESGHAMLHFLFQLDGKSCDDFDMVTVLGMNDSLGSSHGTISEKTKSFTKEKLLNEIKILFAGRVAQEILGTKSIDTGASSDLYKASKIAEDIILKYGMGENKLVFNDDIHKRKNLLIASNKKINSEIKNLLDEEYKKTVVLIEENKKFLFMITDELKSKNTLYYEDILEIYKKYKNENNIKQITTSNNNSHSKKKNKKNRRSRKLLKTY